MGGGLFVVVVVVSHLEHNMGGIELHAENLLLNSNRMGHSHRGMLVVERNEEKMEMGIKLLVVVVVVAGCCNRRHSSLCKGV